MEKTRRIQRRSAWALVAVALLVFAGLIVAIFQGREAERQTAIVLTSLAARALVEQDYERALRIALHGVPATGRLPWSHDWNATAIRGLATKLATAAQFSTLRHQIRPSKWPVTSAAISSDGEVLISAARVTVRSACGTRIRARGSGALMVTRGGSRVSRSITIARARSAPLRTAPRLSGRWRLDGLAPCCCTAMQTTRIAFRSSGAVS